MKKYKIILGLLFFNIVIGQNMNKSDKSYGMMFMGGGRYDDLRM